MFKQRLLTTLILVPLVLLSIYYASPAVLGGLVLVLIAGLAWEWQQLIPIQNPVAKYAFVLLVLLLIWPAWRWPQEVLWADFLLWFAILLAVCTYPVSQKIWGRRVMVGSACLLLLPTVASTIASLYHQVQGKDWIVYLLCLIWASDIGAYLAGKQWGKHKLIPQVSPGKTIEGSLGGLVFALIVAGVGFVYFRATNPQIWFIVALCVACMSMLGDLFISMLKRRSHVKDTGSIFPGHGGVLDRLDSLIAAMPLFYFLLKLVVQDVN